MAYPKRKDYGSSDEWFTALDKWTKNEKEMLLILTDLFYKSPIEKPSWVDNPEMPIYFVAFPLDEMSNFERYIMPGLDVLASNMLNYDVTPAHVWHGIEKDTDCMSKYFVYSLVSKMEKKAA